MIRRIIRAIRLAWFLARYPNLIAYYGIRVPEQDAITLNMLVAWVGMLLVNKGFDGDLRDKHKLIANLHSEVSEYLDAIKKGKEKKEREDEVADIFIRSCSLVIAEKMDITKAVRRKMRHNFTRPYKYGTTEERKEK